MNPGAHSKSRKPEQRVSCCVGIRGQLRGKRCRFRGSHGAPPVPQAAGSAGQQAQPHAEGCQHSHSTSQQRHHGGCGENVAGG